MSHEVRYTALAGDGIAVEERAEIPEALDDLARVGTVIEAVPGLEALEWFGTGPHETYPDRRRSGLVGRWTSTVTDQLVPYVRPQENGGHADVRWLSLADATGAGLRIDLDVPRQVSVTHVRAADLAAATHDVDVVPCPETIIVLDAAHRGPGHGELRPRHAAGLPPRPRDVPLGLDAAPDRPGLTHVDHVPRGHPRVPPVGTG